MKASPLVQNSGFRRVFLDESGLVNKHIKLLSLDTSVGDIYSLKPDLTN